MRLTVEQDAQVRDLAERRGITASEALRVLVDLGRMLDSGERGVAFTPEAQKLLRQGQDVIISFRAGLTPEMCQAVGLGDSPAALGGGLVVVTGEQGDELDAIAEA